MWFILSPKKEYFTGEWQEDVPVWSPDGGKAYLFPSKNDALDHVRHHIEIDKEAKTLPQFTGCRVVNMRDHVSFLLLKKGVKHEMGENADIYLLLDDGHDYLEMRDKLPQSMFGIPFVIKVGGALKPIVPPQPKKKPKGKLPPIKPKGQ